MRVMDGNFITEDGARGYLLVTWNYLLLYSMNTCSCVITWDRTPCAYNTIVFDDSNKSHGVHHLSLVCRIRGWLTF